ncbi:YajG family lipoprotein [Rheinheimera baltica]|uniref:YajG family lipoprotein n=1 Tax=Rheinheimera baltica TaxID=67576 RepID=UPI0004030DEB|nr:YajG family lipoprotein [Rheinheimera baltica]MDP5151789.1 YajG family lipoprotein [Rheinheimera baltica]MDP5190879.1 YajG family lipoprotein [Rheinheimera baltica]
MPFIILVSLLLVGCASSVPNFILAPQVFAVTSNSLQQSRFAFSVSDVRAIAYSLQLRKGNDVEKIETSNDVRLQLEQTLQQAFTAQGANLDVNSSTQMTLKIVQLQALVDQRTLEHAVNNQVAFTLFVQNSTGTFSKNYSGSSSFTAPFQMDIAAVERELRLLTEQVLGQILQDTSWHQAVRS